ncbi:MAG: adenylate/guanylate cyclase domain-containing protein [Alphaproteobacteria bacterium]|nr:adenylate/guanylate cyclase domain-containing protein [Alphaproteobacteria bacterium]
MSSGVERKLTTILAADAEGYSRVMDADEVGTIGALREARKVFAKFIDRHQGRVVNTAGDGLIAEFPSVVEAVECAIEVQSELGGPTYDLESALRFRIGVHLGDVIVDGNDLLGAGVNLAARLQTMAQPGGILISQQVYDQVQSKLSVGFEYLGEKRLKNLAEDVPVYRISLGKERSGASSDVQQARPSRPSRTAKRHAAEPEPEGLRQRIRRHAMLFGAIAALLLVTDIFTGEGLWVHWPGLAMATVIALEATPLFVKGWFNLNYARCAVIVGALTLVNLFSWSGYPWVIWPAGALIAIAVIRQLAARP